MPEIFSPASAHNDNAQYAADTGKQFFCDVLRTRVTRIPILERSEEFLLRSW